MKNVCPQRVFAPEIRRVVVDGRPLQGRPCGFATYTGTTVAALSAGGWTVTLLTSGPTNPCFALPPAVEVTVLPEPRRWRWEQRALPDYLRAERPQIFLASTNRGLPLARLPGTLCVLALLDVIPWKRPHRYLWAPPRFWFLRREALPQLTSALRADRIVTLTESSRRDIRRLLPWKDVSVVPLVLPGPAQPPCTRPRPQFAYIGGLDQRKLTDQLLEAFARFRRERPDFTLVLIGGGYEPLRPAIARLGLAAAVTATGFVPEAEKCRILHESAAIVYPSLDEGFGMAIAEGLIAGTPVICGRGGAQEEVGGAAVLYANPADAAALARAMHEVLDPAKRSALAAARDQQVRVLLDPARARRPAEVFRRFAGGG